MTAMARTWTRCALVALLALTLLPTLAREARAQATWLYWIDTNYAAPKLGRAKTDGTFPTTISLAPFTLPEGLTLDPSGSGKLYWTEDAWTSARVNSIGGNLGGPGLVAAERSSLHGIALDAATATLYWTSSNLITGANVEKCDVTGATHSILATPGATSNPRGIVVDAINGRVIWAEYNTGALSTCPLTSGPVTTLAPVQPGIWGLALDNLNNRLFITNYINGTIQMSLPPYTTAVTILAGLSNPTYIAVDPFVSELYWVEGGVGAQKVQRATEAGTGVLNLGLAETTYGGIALGSPSLAGVPLPPDGAVTEFALLPPAPNPARASTHIEFDLPRDSYAVVRVLDVQGREVARLADGEFPAGRHSADWNIDAQRAHPAAGIYFVRMEAGGFGFTRRLALVR